MVDILTIEKKVFSKIAKITFFGQFAPKTLINQKESICLQDCVTCLEETICGLLPDRLMVNIHFLGHQPSLGNIC